MKVYVDAYLEKNLGDDIFLDMLIKRYPKHKFYAMSRKEKEYNSNNLKVIYRIKETSIRKIFGKFIPISSYNWWKYVYGK